MSASTFSRLLRGLTTNPHYASICRIISHLEKELGYPLDPREVFQAEASSE